MLDTNTCMSGYTGTQLCAPGNFIKTCKLRLSVENSDKHPEEIQHDNGFMTSV